MPTPENSFETDSSLQPSSAPQIYAILPMRTLFSFSAVLATLWYVVNKIVFVACDSEHKSEFSRHFYNIFAAILPTACSFWLILELAGGAKRGTSIVSSLLAAITRLAGAWVWKEFGSGLPATFKTHWFQFVGTVADVFPALIGSCMSKRQGLVLGATACFFSLFRCVSLFQAAWGEKITESVPGLLAGVVNPAVCVIFENASWFLAKSVWRHYRKDAPSSVLSIMTAILVGGAKTLRLTCLILALRSKRYDFRQCMSTILSTMVIDVSTRIYLTDAVYNRLVRKTCYLPSPEDDLLLRTHLQVSYTPLMSSSLLIIAYACIGVGEQWHLSALGAVAIFGVMQFISDMIVLCIQARLVLLERSLPRIESLRDTWQRLHVPGEHLAPRFGLLEERPPANTDVQRQVPESLLGNPPERTLDYQHFCFISVNRMGGILVSLIVCVFMNHPIRRALRIGT